MITALVRSAVQPAAIVSCLTLMLRLGADVSAQECPLGDPPNASRLCITLAVNEGKLAIADSHLEMSATFKERWRATSAKATADMQEGLTVLFRQFLPIYAYGLPDPEAESLLTDQASRNLRTLTGTWAQFLAAYRTWLSLDANRAGEGELLSNFFNEARRSQVVDWGPLELLDEGPPAPLDAATGTVRLLVADPVGDWTSPEYDIQTDNTLPKGIDRNTIAGVLRPLERSLWRPQRIRERIGDFLRPRGFNPQIEIDSAGAPSKRIKILPVERVGKTIFLPQSTPDADVDRLVYLLLPPVQFHTFLDDRQQVLQKVDLPPPALVVDSASLGVPAGQEPVFNAAIFGAQRLELSALGWNLDPVAIAPRSGGPLVALEVTNASATASAIGPQKERRNYIGGGLEYHPGQSWRPLAVYRRTRLFGPGALDLEAGSENTNTIASGNAIFDFVGFKQLRRRLTIQTAYGSDYAVERQFDTVTADERRTGATGRAELELTRNQDGRLISVIGEGRRTAVSLGDADAIDLTTIEAAARYFVDQPSLASPYRLLVLPSVRLGIAGDANFARYGVSAAFHRLTRGHVEFDLAAAAGHTTAATPIFELLSLGGADSIRGFRRDDILARTTWNVQPEIWTPLPGTTDATGGLRLFLRRNAHAAFFADVGGAADTLGDFSGVKAGPGLGLRVTQGPAVLKLDWARPFGDAATRARNGRFYFTVQLTRPF